MFKIEPHCMPECYILLTGQKSTWYDSFSILKTSEKGVLSLATHNSITFSKLFTTLLY